MQSGENPLFSQRLFHSYFLLSHTKAASLLSDCHDLKIPFLSPSISITEFEGKLFSLHPQHVPGSIHRSDLPVYYPHQFHSAPLTCCGLSGSVNLPTIYPLLKVSNPPLSPIYTFKHIYSSVVLKA